MASEHADQDLLLITKILCSLLGKENINDVDEDIYQVGLTSILVLPLLVELEESFQVIIPDADFTEARTIRSLGQLIGQLRCSS